MDFLQVPIARLRKIHNMLGGNIFVLSVIKEDAANVPKAVMDVQNLHTLLNDIPHSFHYIYHDDVEKGLNDFAELHYADVIITLPQKHSWAGKLFNQSHTQKMIFYIKTPVLALQD
jgi:K+-sensing histidine kinase KdpD